MYQNENNTGRKKNPVTFNSMKRIDRLFILHVYMYTYRPIQVFITNKINTNTYNVV